MNEMQVPVLWLVVPKPQPDNLTRSCCKRIHCESMHWARLSHKLQLCCIVCAKMSGIMLDICNDRANCKRMKLSIAPT